MPEGIIAPVKKAGPLAHAQWGLVAMGFLHILNKGLYPHMLNGVNIVSMHRIPQWGGSRTPPHARYGS